MTGFNGEKSRRLDTKLYEDKTFVYRELLLEKEDLLDNDLRSLLWTRHKSRRWFVSNGGITEPAATTQPASAHTIIRKMPRVRE